MRILIADDHPAFRQGLALMLRATDDLEVVGEAATGAEAVALARKVLPDLVLLDLMMPEVNGFRVVEALRQDPLTAGTPLLVVTAKQITDEDRRALDGHEAPIRVVEKAGFDRQAFLTEVRRALPPHGAAVTA